MILLACSEMLPQHCSRKGLSVMSGDKALAWARQEAAVWYLLQLKVIVKQIN